MLNLQRLGWCQKFQPSDCAFLASSSHPDLSKDQGQNSSHDHMKNTHSGGSMGLRSSCVRTSGHCCEIPSPLSSIPLSITLALGDLCLPKHLWLIPLFFLSFLNLSQACPPCVSVRFPSKFTTPTVSYPSRIILRLAGISSSSVSRHSF